MEIGDLLLVIGLIIVGLLAIAYVVFGLGSRSASQYLLTCPPCSVNAPTTHATPVPLPLEPGIGVSGNLPGVPTPNYLPGSGNLPGVPTPTYLPGSGNLPGVPTPGFIPGATGNLPGVPTPGFIPGVTGNLPGVPTPTYLPGATGNLPGVPTPTYLPGATGNLPVTSGIVGAGSIAPSPPPLEPGSTVLFKNRSTGKYLSVCSGCSNLDPLVVMAHDSNPAVSYTQWMLSPTTQGYLFSTKFNNSMVQFEPSQSIAKIKPVGTNMILTPVDSRGYLISNGTLALKVCCSAMNPTPNCACPQFSDNSQNGVTLVDASHVLDSSAIWDIYTYTTSGGAQPLLGPTISRRKVALRKAI
jgi:hypothetical protein